MKYVQDPVFIEYVDGAGYYSSLNGDLKKLLAYDDTHSFIQIRSAPVKLRRIFQQIGFLAPVEVEHAILLRDGVLSEVKGYLTKESYSETEVDRCINFCLENGFIGVDGDKVSISESRIETVRRYFLLDLVVINSKAMTISEIRATYTAAGYDRYYGISMKGVGELLEDNEILSKNLWGGAAEIMSDLEWLVKAGFLTAH